MKVQGIYAIRNTVSGRVYVGSTSDMAQRFRTHRKRLKGNYHCSWRFQASWNKHGPDAFEFSLLEVVEHRSDLLIREQHWIDALNANCPDRGFNVRGTAEGTLGFKHTADAVARITAAATGRKHTVEAKAKMSAARKAGPKRTLSETHKAAIRAGSIAWASTPENKAKVSQVHTGRVVSTETRRRRSVSMTGKVCSDETKAKLRAANLGKKHPSRQKQVPQPRLQHPDQKELLIEHVPHPPHRGHA